MEVYKTLELNLKLILEEHKSCMIKICCLRELRDHLFNGYKLTEEQYFLKSGGIPVYNYDQLKESVYVVPKLCGGKGGFGSMLRAIGAQIEKTTNREACRDLSGRRLRDINEEERLKNWISQKSVRENEAKERKKRKLEKLKAEPKYEFSDKNYENERSDLVEKINDSVEQGLKASISKKRPCENEVVPVKKRKTILDFEDDLSSTDSEDSSDEAPNKAMENSNDEIPSKASV